MEKLFLGVHIGFNTQLTDWKIDIDNGGFAGLFAGLRAGYKLHFTKMFFADPSLSYTYSKTSFDSLGMIPNNFGWQEGLRIGLAF